MCGLSVPSRGNPVGSIYIYIYMTAFISIVQLDVVALQRVLSSWIMVTHCFTVKLHHDRSLVTVYTMKSCDLLYSSMRNMLSASAFPVFPIIVLTGGSHRGAGISSVIFQFLVCLSSVSWHTGRVDSAKISSVSVCCVLASFTASWSGLWRFSTALKYPSTGSTIGLVCINGLSGPVCMKQFIRV